MTTLSELVNQDITDPRKEGFPCFCVFASDGGNFYMNSTTYNSEFNVISPPYLSVGSTTTSYQFGMAGDAMYGRSGDDNYATTTSLSSQSSAGIYTASLHNVDQYPMGQIYDCSSTGYRTGLSVHAQAESRYGQSTFLINHVLPSGVRPRRFFCLSQNEMYEVPSLVNMLTKVDTLDIGPYRVANTLLDARGAACYNEKTKTLVTTHGNTTASTQVNIFKSTTVDLNSCESLAEFFNSCTVTGFTVSRTYNAASRYDRCMLIGDNDLIFMAYRVGNTLQNSLINPIAETLTALDTLSGTTSYGENSGPAFDTKFNLTWDGKWAALYQPYSQYGNGIVAAIVSVEDPARYFTYIDTSTGNGGAFMPTGENAFIYFSGGNTDSNGVIYNRISLRNTSTVGTTNTVYTTAGLNGTLTTISNGGAINPTTVQSTLSGGGYTTQYPNYLTVSWWPINGKRSYEGVVK